MEEWRSVRDVMRIQDECAGSTGTFKLIKIRHQVNKSTARREKGDGRQETEDNSRGWWQINNAMLINLSE